uniref:SDR family oxidoreductase n=1 Tax=Listeria monocytogenes TaxID=1639 RepID=UPI0034A16F6C
LLLAEKGAKLVLAARRVEKLEKIVQTIKANSGEAIFAKSDVTKREDNKKLVELAIERYGKVDAIFLNAGIMSNSPLSALKEDEWEQMIDINIKGVLNGMAAVLPSFSAQKSGHSVAASSVAGLKAYPGGAVYG